MYLFAVLLFEVIYEELPRLLSHKTHTVRPRGEKLLAHPGGQTFINSEQCQWSG